MHKKNGVIGLGMRGRLAAAIGHYPREFVGIATIVCMSSAVIVNALFLQHRPHPAPILVPAPLLSKLSPPHTQSDLQSRPKPQAGIVGADAKRTTVASRTNDPIAALIEPQRNVSVVQRALANAGYGQLKITGVYNLETQVAIEKFERDRHLPVTGRISDHLLRELTAITGRPLE